VPRVASVLVGFLAVALNVRSRAMCGDRLSRCPRQGLAPVARFLDPRRAEPRRRRRPRPRRDLGVSIRAAADPSHHPTVGEVCWSVSRSWLPGSRCSPPSARARTSMTGSSTRRRASTRSATATATPRWLEIAEGVVVVPQCRRTSRAGGGRQQIRATPIAGAAAGRGQRRWPRRAGTCRPPVRGRRGAVDYEQLRVKGGAIDLGLVESATPAVQDNGSCPRRRCPTSRPAEGRLARAADPGQVRPALATKCTPSASGGEHRPRCRDRRTGDTRWYRRRSTTPRVVRIAVGGT